MQMSVRARRQSNKCQAAAKTLAACKCKSACCVLFFSLHLACKAAEMCTHYSPVSSYSAPFCAAVESILQLFQREFSHFARWALGGRQRGSTRDKAEDGEESAAESHLASRTTITCIVVSLLQVMSSTALISWALIARQRIHFVSFVFSIVVGGLLLWKSNFLRRI